MSMQGRKQEIISKFGRSAGDTGSAEVQIALLAARITDISEHLKKFPKDFHSQRGLLALVGQRRSFEKYLQRVDKSRYVALKARLAAK